MILQSEQFAATTCLSPVAYETRIGKSFTVSSRMCALAFESATFQLPIISPYSVTSETAPTWPSTVESYFVGPR